IPIYQAFLAPCIQWFFIFLSRGFTRYRISTQAPKERGKSYIFRFIMTITLLKPQLGFNYVEYNTRVIYTLSP
ncbi:MAG: hypothetical protein JXB88_00595, partial [Spirochaetales bacterium]|nr:hypothetical protein [Spirochaetales bacterium]